MRISLAAATFAATAPFALPICGVMTTPLASADIIADSNNITFDIHGNSIDISEFGQSLGSFAMPADGHALNLFGLEIAEFTFHEDTFSLTAGADISGLPPDGSTYALFGFAPLGLPVFVMTELTTPASSGRPSESMDTIATLFGNFSSPPITNGDGGLGGSGGSANGSDGSTSSFVSEFSQAMNGTHVVPDSAGDGDFIISESEPQLESQLDGISFGPNLAPSDVASALVGSYVNPDLVDASTDTINGGDVADAMNSASVGFDNGAYGVAYFGDVIGL